MLNDVSLLSMSITYIALRQIQQQQQKQQLTKQRKQQKQENQQQQQPKVEAKQRIHQRQQRHHHYDNADDEIYEQQQQQQQYNHQHKQQQQHNIEAPPNHRTMWMDAAAPLAQQLVNESWWFWEGGDADSIIASTFKGGGGSNYTYSYTYSNAAHDGSANGSGSAAGVVGGVVGVGGGSGGGGGGGVIGIGIGGDASGMGGGGVGGVGGVVGGVGGNISARLIDSFNGSSVDVGFGGIGMGMGMGIGNGSGIDLLRIAGNGTLLFRSVDGNRSANGSADVDEIIVTDSIVALAKMAAMSVVLGLMILITIIGNVFVIAAIILERNLQNVANYLVASLAVADLFVACLVMPLGAVYEISSGWILGPELCDIWTSCDVLCCTASILHLVAIASDRYWTVTNIDYNNLRTPGRVFFMIFCVWVTALVVSLAPQFGWKDPEYMQRIEQQKCMVSQDVAYQIFATCCTFYVPLLVILVLYWKIYKIAQKRIQRRSRRALAGNNNAAGNAMQKQKRQQQLDNNQQQQQQKQQQQKSQQPEQSQQQQQQQSTHQRTTSAERRRLKICFSRSAGCDRPLNTVSGSSSTQQFDGLKIISSSSLNVREETEFSVSNFDSKSHAGTELTTASSDMDEFRPPTLDEISTVSRQIATTTQQQHALAISLATTACLGTTTTATTPPAIVTTSAAATHSTQMKLLSSIANPHHKLTKRRQLLEAKRERKAAQTLAIITGAFVVCWLPFFVMALLQSVCKECAIPAAVASTFLWLGYFNSTLNPIIYTIFNPEFRRAFRRILYGRKQFASHCRSGKI